MKKMASALSALKITAKIMCALIILIINMPALAETRNIYVGDIITLEISGATEDEMRQSFHNFEITELLRTNSGYIISVRTFTAATHTIMLNGKELLIEVASTLTEIERDIIYEGEGMLLEPGIKPPAWALLCISASTFVLSGVTVFLKKRSKLKEAEPYEAFRQKASSLSAQDDNYLAELTYHFKIYLERVYNLRIIGKTSKEIASALKDTPPYILREVETWLLECDMLKYSGIVCETEKKYEHYTKLTEISRRIEEAKPKEAEAV